MKHTFKSWSLEHKTSLLKYSAEYRRKKRATIKEKKLKKSEANKKYRAKNSSSLLKTLCIISDYLFNNT